MLLRALVSTDVFIRDRKGCRVQDAAVYLIQMVTAFGHCADASRAPFQMEF